MGASSGAKAGAVFGTFMGGPVGTIPGTISGTGIGAVVGVFRSSYKEASVEAIPVKSFLQRTVECNRLAQVESQIRARETEPGMSASTFLPQIFVITKMFGVFALYPYTVEIEKSLLRDPIIQEHGANPTDPITVTKKK
jgi:hypothetical protein